MIPFCSRAKLIFSSKDKVEQNGKNPSARPTGKLVNEFVYLKSSSEPAGPNSHEFPKEKPTRRFSCSIQLWGFSPERAQ